MMRLYEYADGLHFNIRRTVGSQEAFVGLNTPLPGRFTTLFMAENRICFLWGRMIIEALWPTDHETGTPGLNPEILKIRLSRP